MTLRLLLRVWFLEVEPTLFPCTLCQYVKLHLMDQAQGGLVKTTEENRPELPFPHFQLEFELFFKARDLRNNLIITLIVTFLRKKLIRIYN
jgi:hypothetical protein